MTTEELAGRLLNACPELRGAAISACEHLAGDASARRYVRIRLRGGSLESVVLMLLAQGAGPISAGGQKRTQDDTFVELAGWFRQRGVRVPRLIHDARDQGALLVEDVGDVALWHFTFNQLNPAGQAVEQTLGGDAAVVELYRRAVDVIAAIQACPADSGCVAFQRSLELAEYTAEARRFIDHYLLPNGFSKTHVGEIETMLNSLCQSIASQPRALIHRDFMPWNLQISPAGAVIMIDFQDALVAASVYDCVSLLHDRDTDFALGPARLGTVFRYCRERLGGAENFAQRYCEVLLQRHFRLAGQFCLLTERTGKPIYRSWVPGCFRRIGRTLPLIPAWSRVLEILAEAVPEVAQGASEPWDFMS